MPKSTSSKVTKATTGSKRSAPKRRPAGRKVKMAKKGVKTARRVVTKKPLQITVVDKHHHVMKPMWDAVLSRAIPGQGCKLLHFDSHPDMGTIGADSAPKSRERQRNQRIVPKIFNNRFDKEECLALSDIATWIPTLVAQGLVDEVIWCAGHWCGQFPQGTFDLFVGRDKKDGMMKIAVPGDKKLDALAYWAGDDSMCKVADLDECRPWKLHVVKFQKNGTFAPQGMKKIVDICKHSPWILDIDEDYLSCQNPFTTEFTQLYGEEMYNTLVRIYQGMKGDDEKYNNLLEEIVKNDTFLEPPSKYMKDDDVMAAVAELTKSGMSRPKAERLLEEWRVMSRTILPEEKDEDDYLEMRDVKDAGVITDTAGVINVPHHISTLPFMLTMLKATRDLFESIKRVPGVVTVATSRYDEYTPEPQANTINTLTLDLLKEVWEDKRTPKIARRDYRSSLSIDDRYDPKNPNVLALFLSNGKKWRLRPASK